MNTASNPVEALFTGTVSPEWLSQGVRFSDAWRAFETSFRAEAIQAEKEFAELHRLLPELYTHRSKFWDPARDPELRNALHGPARDAWVRYCSHRTGAHQMVIGRLTMDGSLRAFGDPGYAGAPPEWIQPRAWQHLSADETKADVLRSESRSYWCVRVVDPATAPQTGPSKPLPDSREKPPFNVRKATGFLATRKATDWPERPTEQQSKDFLKTYFRGIPNEPHRQVLRNVWEPVKPGPRSRKRAETAE